MKEVVTHSEPVNSDLEVTGGRKVAVYGAVVLWEVVIRETKEGTAAFGG